MRQADLARPPALAIADESRQRRERCRSRSLMQQPTVLQLAGTEWIMPAATSASRNAAR